MLERLYDIIYKYREYAILTGLVAISFLLMALNDSPQIRRIRSISTVVFGVVQEQLSFIPTYFHLRSENDFLRRNNIELMDEVQRLREAKLENIRLHQMLGLRDEAPFKLLAARVVNKNLTLLRNTLTIDAGTEEGMKPQMPVIGDGGLIGLVTTVAQHYSVVNIILNTDFRASAKIQRSRVDGIIAWDGKSLFLKNVPKMRDVKVGDVVVTSEYSSSFPDGIRIGLVSEVSDQPGSLFKSIVVDPGVDFIRLEEVFVVLSIPAAERSELELRAAQRAGK
jgi:rod shape-determining protein MreC